MMMCPSRRSRSCILFESQDSIRNGKNFAYCWAKVSVMRLVFDYGTIMYSLLHLFFMGLHTVYILLIINLACYTAYCLLFTSKSFDYIALLFNCLASVLIFIVKVSWCFMLVLQVNDYGQLILVILNQISLIMIFGTAFHKQVGTGFEKVFCFPIFFKFIKNRYARLWFVEFKSHK